MVAPDTRASETSDERLGVVVVAAGRSTRMGGTDKTFALVHGVPLVVHTLRRLAESEVVERIVLVVAAEAVQSAKEMVSEFGIAKVVAVCAGGSRRQDSVYAGLVALGECRWVAVHDGARPCVTGDVLTRGLEAARASGAAIAAVPVKDTIKVVDDGQVVVETPDRSTLWAAQTPQIFQRGLLMEAHRNAQGDFTDDAAMVESSGHPVSVFWGSYDNLKVTTPEDLAIAEQIIGQSMG